MDRCILEECPNYWTYRFMGGSLHEERPILNRNTLRYKYPCVMQGYHLH